MANYREGQMRYGERAMNKVRAQNNVKIYPKIKPGVQRYSSSEYPGREVDFTSEKKGLLTVIPKNRVIGLFNLSEEISPFQKV